MLNDSNDTCSSKAGAVLEKAEAPLLNDRQFRLWAEMLENKTGVRIASHRDDFVKRQIVRRVNELGLDDVENYFREVSQSSAGAREWGVLLDRLLVKETQFFRHRPSHEFFQNCVISHLQSPSRNQHFTVCSVGCSTGEEVYSLAMSALDSYRAADITVSFSVAGVDVSSEAIQSARQGVYASRHVETVPERQKNDYFTAPTTGSMEVRAELKKRVGFFVGNLFDQNCPGLSSPLDVIFCQNVLIYFKKWRRRDLLNSFVGKLKPGGYLVVGPGELNDWQPTGLSRVACPDVQVFEKPL